MAIHSSEINGVTWVIFVFCVGLEVVCLKQNFCCPFKKKKKNLKKDQGLCPRKSLMYLKLQSSHNKHRRDVKPSAFALKSV